ncbi:BT4734/BF3469 family protein, partial [Crenothrix sp.]|uniref:BT4734/BF3469 family protein n=1 Tax=Crenothrix sp. TaxID=3100433 RepID=UPI00374CC71A
MNPTPINLSSLKKVYSKEVQQVTLEKVIDMIRLEKLSANVQELRGIKDDEKIRKYKRKFFPAFFPTLLLGTKKNTLDNNSQPTGIVQFDIDKKDNLDLDFALLRQEIEKLPEVIYAFTSPSEGLKFGLLTDFKRAVDEENQTLKDRYKQAYQLTSNYVVDSVAMDFKLDNSVGHLKYSCLQSSDPRVYFNPNCKKFAVDSRCVSLPVKQNSYTPNTLDQANIVELLAYIPKHLNYNERLPINGAVLAELNHSGIALLEGHWATGDRVKLSKDLRDLLKRVGQGNFNNNIGTLINEAKRHGYKHVTGKKRSSLKPQTSDHQLEPLLSAVEAEAKLKEIVQQFFTDKVSRFINFSAGAGKTYTLIKSLEVLNPTAKILYLVKTHELAAEITKTFDSVRADRLNQPTFKEAALSKSKMIHVKERSELCENPVVKQKYNVADKKTAIPIPADQCAKDCQYYAKCAYTAQFNTIFQGIRVMMGANQQKALKFHGILANLLTTMVYRRFLISQIL